MKFQIVMIEPQGYAYAHFLYDIVKLFCGALETMGHDCVIAKNTVDPGRLNILLGGHLLQTKAEVASLAESGVPYIVYQSEVITPTGINTSGDLARLEEVYLPLLRGATHVWDGGIGNLEPLKAHGVDAMFLEPGYDPCLQEIRHKARKDVDFLFYGSLTPHRAEVIEALQRANYKVAYQFDPVAMYRNDLIARSKIQLVPRQSDEMMQLPYWRIVYQLHNRCVTVVEECAHQAWLQDCFLWAPPEDYIELCKRTIARADLARVGQQFHAKFAARPFSEKLEAALDAMPTASRVSGLVAQS